MINTIEIENINENQEFSRNFLEKINLQLENIKELYKDPLDGILKYNKEWRCTTFFWDSEKNITVDDVEDKEKTIQDNIQKIQSLLREIENKSELSNSIKEAYIASLKSMSKRLEMFQNALWIEAEKSWMFLSNHDCLKYNESSIKLLEEIYGERVSENKQEVTAVLSKMNAVFDKGKWNISTEEQQIFQKFLHTSATNFWYDFIPTSSRITLKTTNNTSSREHIDKEKLKKISQDIINFYKQYSNNNSLQNWEAVLDQGTDSINVSGINEQLRIPEWYANVNSQKVTQTIAGHEIEQHLLQWNVNNKVLGKWFSSGWYDFISEGMAKINEDISTGKINSLEDLKNNKEDVSLWIIGVFVCENYDFEDAVQLLTIYKKLITPEVSDEVAKEFAQKIVIRRKRFVSYSLPGSSPKDTLYQRGKNRVIDYLTEDWSLENAIKKYKDLNTFKLWPSELHLINEIKDELHISDEQALYPLFIGRIIADKLAHGVGSAKHYMKEMNLNSKDLDISTKKALVEILQQLKED